MVDSRQLHYSSKPDGFSAAFRSSVFPETSAKAEAPRSGTASASLGLAALGRLRRRKAETETPRALLAFLR
jgi:hypothetical protein